eukprot:m.11707 g.11707  ORF g.11707 m.11707 type:complete len:167 (+) comp7801_c0_seq1:129-629(+)
MTLFSAQYVSFLQMDVNARLHALEIQDQQDELKMQEILRQLQELRSQTTLRSPTPMNAAKLEEMVDPLAVQLSPDQLRHLVANLRKCPSAEARKELFQKRLKSVIVSCEHFGFLLQSFRYPSEKVQAATFIKSRLSDPGKVSTALMPFLMNDSTETLESVLLALKG